MDCERLVEAVRKHEIIYVNSKKITRTVRRKAKHGSKFQKKLEYPVVIMFSVSSWRFLLRYTIFYTSLLWIES